MAESVKDENFRDHCVRKGSRQIGGTDRREGRRETTRIVPKPYVSKRELAALTPWTVDAIKGMIRRGVLQQGVHWFRPEGRILFKWEAVVELIESGQPEFAVTARGSAIEVPMLRGGVLRVPA